MASVSREMRRLFFLRLLIASIPACTGLPGGAVFVSRPEASVFLHRTRRANYMFEELRRGELERECREEECFYEEEAFWRLYTGAVFVSRPEASVFLHRTRRANFMFEELKRGDLERECREEECFYEEVQEIFALHQQLEAFWRLYTGAVFVSSPEASVFLHRTRRANFMFQELKRGDLEREIWEEECFNEEEAFWRLYKAVDHCLSSPCKNGATCTRHLDTYVCKCPPGFHGSHCDKGIHRGFPASPRSGGTS